MDPVHLCAGGALNPLPNRSVLYYWPRYAQELTHWILHRNCSCFLIATTRASVSLDFLLSWMVILHIQLGQRPHVWNLPVALPSKRSAGSQTWRLSNGFKSLHRSILGQCLRLPLLGALLKYPARLLALIQWVNCIATSTFRLIVTISAWKTHRVHHRWEGFNRWWDQVFGRTVCQRSLVHKHFSLILFIPFIRYKAQPQRF